MLGPASRRTAPSSKGSIREKPRNQWSSLANAPLRFQRPCFCQPVCSPAQGRLTTPTILPVTSFRSQRYAVSCFRRREQTRGPTLAKREVRVCVWASHLDTASGDANSPQTPFLGNIYEAIVRKGVHASQLFFAVITWKPVRFLEPCKHLMETEMC